jgi:hypothetical protein
LKLNSVKFGHHFNGIVIPNNHPIKGTTAFHKNEGFPIKLDIESFLTLSIQCRHKAIDEFKIPIEHTIEWKIVKGAKDGVFKHGHGHGTKYSDSDKNDCVVYHPPRDGIGKIHKVKEIPILIKIGINKKNGEIIRNLQSNKSTETTNMNLCG